MKVRIYKSGGTTGKFISRLERFTSLPTAATGIQVDNEREMKVSIANLLKTTDTPNNLIVQQLIKSGYPLDYSKKLVDDVSDEMEEEDYYASKKRRDKKKKSMLDSKLIEEDDARREKKRMEEDELTEARNKKTKALGEDAVNAIEEEHETEEEENEDSDQELLEEFNEDDELLMNDNDAVSEEALDLATAQYGMEMKDDNYRIQWPGMEMDLSTLRYGGMPNKNKFINSTVKQLRKAEMGMEKDPSIGKNPNPYGTIDNPLGENLTPNKSLVSAIKGSAQSFVNEERYKKQAEQMYNKQFMQPQAENGGANDWATNLHNYGEALSHEMPNLNTTGMNTDFSGQEMAFGGTSRRVRRANRGMFGTPIAPPFVDTDYEFGPLGGVRKAQATYDMSKLSELMKNNPNYLKEYMANAQQSGPNLKNVWNWWTSNSPGFNFNQSYMTTRTVSSAPKTRLKWTTEKINDAADPSKNNEVKLTNNPVTTDQTKKYQDYIDWWSSLGPAASGRGKAAPISINEFIAKGADGLSEYDSWVSRAPSTNVSTRAAQPKANLTDEEILNYNKFASESQDQAISSTIPSVYAPITNKSIAPINTPVPRNENMDFLNSDRFSDENLDESLMYPQDESYMMNTQESSLPAASNASVTNSSPYSLTPNQTGSQTEEFCYPGQSCYSLSDDQSWDRDLFNELPQALSAYGAKNNSDWFTDDEQFNKTKLDLSKVTKKEAMEAIKSRIPKNDLPRMKNLDEYLDKWLKFQKENQKAYGSTKTTDLYDYDFSGDSPKYADWLNVSGKAGAQNPYDIFGATPALDFEDYQKAFGGSINDLQPDQYGNLQKFIYGGDEYAYGGALNMFPDGGEQIDPAYKDARGMNYQDYIDRHSELASKQVNDSPNSTYTGAYSTAAPQTWAEWKAEQEAEKNPNASTTTTTTNTGTTTNNTGTGSYDKSYFDKLFSSDPNAKKGFEEYLRSQGLPTNDQLKQNQGNMTYTNSAGNPVVGYGPAKQNFGSMIGSMFGLTKDFNYYTSPDGQIDQAMIAQMMKDPTKNITKSQYKEGKWWNPFDKDKKITKWEVMNATGNAANTNNTNTNTTNTNTTNTNTNPGWKGYPYALPGDENKSTTNTNLSTEGSTSTIEGAQEDVQAKDASGKIGRNQMLKTGVNPDTGENIGIGSKGELIDSPQFYNERNTQRYTGTDIDGEKMYENYGDKDRLNEAFDITGFSKKDFRKQGPALFGDTEGGTRSELANEYEGKGFFGKRKMRKDFMKNDLWDMPLDSGVINERRGNAKIAPNTFKGPFSKPGESNPMTDPKYIPTGEDFNFASPASGSAGGNNKPAPVVPQGNEDYLDPLPMAYGGYIPAYMAYGGYMPDYGYGGMTYFNPGGVVGPNPEFAGPQENNFGADADNNGIPDYLEVKDGKSDMAINNVGTTQDKEGPTSYTLEEQTAKTLDLGMGARTANKGVAGLTNLLEKANFAKKRQAQNSKFMYAQDIDRQLTYKGRADQEGVDKKAGFETGRTFTKMGGAQNTNESKAYSKGKVYSLTMDEIREIQRNGGSVKFIK
jgi:hypothetical protein